MLNFFKNFFHRDNDTIFLRKKQQFDNIMNVAKEINEIRPQALKDLIKILGKEYQFSLMSYCLLNGRDNKLNEVGPKDILFNQFTDVSDNISLDSLKKSINKTALLPLHLSQELILPWPWESSRLVNSLLYIGEGKIQGAWQQDSNHKIEYWLPLGIGWVHGGNHSLANGILNSTGTIESYEAYDISEIYQFVECDGINYYRKGTKIIISPVCNLQFACIFEIGRLISQKL